MKAGQRKALLIGGAAVGVFWLLSRKPAPTSAGAGATSATPQLVLGVQGAGLIGIGGYRVGQVWDCAKATPAGWALNFAGSGMTRVCWLVPDSAASVAALHS